MTPTSDGYRISDRGAWSDWERCVRETIAGSPLPKVLAPDRWETRCPLSPGRWDTKEMLVYILWHASRPNPDAEDEESLLLGVYSSEDLARDRIRRCRDNPGFSEHPDGFIIDPYEVDKDQWTSGFISVD
jgi:hypothetical protein